MLPEGWRGARWGGEPSALLPFPQRGSERKLSVPERGWDREAERGNGVGNAAKGEAEGALGMAVCVVIGLSVRVR